MSGPRIADRALFGFVRAESAEAVCGNGWRTWLQLHIIHYPRGHILSAGSCHQKFGAISGVDLAHYKFQITKEYLNTEHVVIHIKHIDVKFVDKKLNSKSQSERMGGFQNERDALISFPRMGSSKPPWVGS